MHGSTASKITALDRTAQPCHTPSALSEEENGRQSRRTNTARPNKPWFCAVSFVNPHDMSGFPYGYGLANTSDPNRGTFGPQGPHAPEVVGYVPPPSPFGPQPPATTDQTILPPPPVALPVGASGSQPPAGPNGQPWNINDSPSSNWYGPSGTGVYGKPTLQLVYQNNQGIELGAVKDVNGWYTFLNYYFWMQANVDAQIGRVINALNNAPNTIIIFSSDHGDYAGSHWIHGKGFALYDESISVPLYIKFPGQKGIPLMVPYACSSVDILPFVYIMALGNNTWRTNSKDLVAYLWNRESISDFIFKPNPVQRRLSSIPNANPGVNNSGAN